MTMTLAVRVAQPDLTGLPDWRVAEILTTPDDSLPPVVTLAETIVGPAQVMSALGGAAGAISLDSLEAMAGQSSRIRWAMHLIKGNGINVAEPEVMQTIGELASDGLLTTQQAAQLLALAERRRSVSWAEHYGIEVTARTVGLARGARP